MKKLYILLAFLLFSAGLRAQQTNLTEAVDFTVTDCHGQTYNLFEILDRGQAVFIDFFFYTCNQCQVISPYITGSYPLMGCNMHDVFYMEISYTDNDAMCQRWEEEHGLQPHDCNVGIDENVSTLTLFPNPANENVTLVGENLEEVTLYNIMGQKVDAFFTEESQLVISTAKYPDGIYFVKTNSGETQRLVIVHE